MATRMGKDHDKELGIEESAGSLRGHTLGRYLNFAPKEHLGWMCAMSKGKGTPGGGHEE